MKHSATYSPEDNKIRIYPGERLDDDKEWYTGTFKKAGYRWAPMQKLFYAVWSPNAEDIALELAGEIGDEDTSLVERSEERADRFDDYATNRARDAETAHAAVSAIADNIPLGQPILVGHHSERHARRDQEKIQNGMRKSIDMWKKSEYWKARAAGALQNAKYKERPDVRARRIKGLESEIRVMRAKYTPDPKTRPIMQRRAWSKSADAPEEPHVWCSSGSRGGSWVPVASLPELERHYTRWIEHCERRLEYERAMLQESGGLVADQQEIAVGGRILVAGEWLTVLRVNRKDGTACSFRTTRRWCPVISAEEVKGYEPPSAEDAQATKTAMTKAPLCNYPGERFATCTKEAWDNIYKDYRGSREIAATASTARHRVRSALGFRLQLPPPEGKELEPHYCSANRTHASWPVYIVDAPRKDPPAAGPDDPKATGLPQHLRENHPDLAALEAKAERAAARAPADSAREETFTALEATLKAGVQVTVVPDLFPTPPDLARRMVELAGELEGKRILEPEAGTGNLLRAMYDVTPWADCEHIVAVEINPDLVKTLEYKRDLQILHSSRQNLEIICADFLDLNVGWFDIVLMNPPFSGGADIKHVNHALTMLRPGGRLIAIVAGGPRQEAALQPLASTWEKLPEGTFKESGTNVNTVLLTIDKPTERPWPEVKQEMKDNIVGYEQEELASSAGQMQLF